MVIIGFRSKHARFSTLTPAEYKKLVRLYVPETGFVQGKEYYLSDGQVHYLRSVMRKSQGDLLRVFNGRDGEWIAEIKEINKKNVLIELTHQSVQQKINPDIWVLASPVKKEAFDLMVQKSCELGAARFIPVLCDHTVVHKMNRERLQSIAVEAAEQSERLDIMTVEEVMDLKKCLNSIINNRFLISCIERVEAASLLQVAQSQAGKPVAVLVGPEGGFSDQEIDFINNFKNGRAVSLGPRILRAETALISALSCIQLAN